MNLEVNIPLLRKAVEWAEAEAAKPFGDSQWEQRDWVITNAIGRDCGTCYCIAGYVAQLVDDRYMSTALVDGVHCGDVAAEALGLNVDQEEELFAATNDIEDIRRVANMIAGEAL